MSTWIVHTAPISADHYTRALADANTWLDAGDDIENLFTIVAPIGKGSFGMVFRAINEDAQHRRIPGEDYAIKVFYDTSYMGNEFARQELRAALQFHYAYDGACARHPHVLCYLGNFRAPFARFSRQDYFHHHEVWDYKQVMPADTVYRCIVTRFIDSENMLNLVYDETQRHDALGSVRRPRFDISPRAFARLLVTAADGLHSMHTVGMWHHDVKPANMQTLNYHIEGLAETILIDLGGACTHFEHCHSVTTPGYAPPPHPSSPAPASEIEVLSEVCSRDLYGLGVSFAQLALRQIGYFPHALQHHHRHTFIGVPFIDQLLQDMMHIDWRRRPTAEALATQLNRWLSVE